MIGVQSYGLRNLLLDQPQQTIEHLSAIGYDALEPLVALQQEQHDVPPAHFSLPLFDGLYRLTRACGMVIPCIQVSPLVHGKLLSAQAFAQQLSDVYFSYNITNFAVSGKFDTSESAAFWGEYLRTVNLLLQGLPCRVLYHNHNSEMTPLPQGGYPMDAFIQAAGGQVLLELDVGWSGIVTDEVAVARRYLEHIAILHLKDFAPGWRGRITCETSRPECFAPSGLGDMRIPEVLSLRPHMPHFSGLLVVEQNDSTTSIMDDLTAGFRRIRALA